MNIFFSLCWWCSSYDKRINERLLLQRELIGKALLKPCFSVSSRCKAASLLPPVFFCI
uniref:hypothetical protein n=1 Tax=Salmonella sp. TaxID=599 RepID=UPI001CD9F537|nr:hypothetical protein [Salmonella sp.]